MEEKRFYIGSLKYDAENESNNGWVIGEYKDDPIRKTKDVEIKYFEFQEGITGHDKKVSSVFEVNILFEGEFEGEVDDQPITLKANEYLVIPPGISNNVAKVAKKITRGITIKAPSDSNNKTIV
jgi:quercetin dioxygenase-like cupin family protein